MLIVRGLRISSERLGVSGQCDVVEFHRAKDGILLHGREGHWNVYPVEYKRGVPKADRSDEAQLCAQAMCLEEMLGTTIPEGALFYGDNRRRTTIAFDQELRDTVTAALDEILQSPAARGRGLKSRAPPRSEEASGRPPHGGRGLK